MTVVRWEVHPTTYLSCAELTVMTVFVRKVLLSIYFVPLS